MLLIIPAFHARGCSREGSRILKLGGQSSFQPGRGAEVWSRRGLALRSSSTRSKKTQPTRASAAPGASSTTACTQTAAPFEHVSNSGRRWAAWDAMAATERGVIASAFTERPKCFLVVS